MTPKYTKIIVLLSLFILISSANAQEMSLSNLAQRANEIMFASHEEVQPNPNARLGTSQEQKLLERLPELPPDLDAKLRDQLWNEDVLKVKKKVDTMKKTETSGGLRGSRSLGNNQHD